MAIRSFDASARSAEAERFPPPLNALDWVCHVACWLLLIAGLYYVIDNLNAFRAVEHSAQGGPRIEEWGLWALLGLALAAYLLFVALTPLPRIYNYPFALKRGEERIVFPATRSFLHVMAVQAVLLMVLIAWDMVRTVVHGVDSVTGLVVGGLCALMLVSVIGYLVWLMRLHARYQPPVEAEARIDSD
jgi:hypothetical protein